MINTTNAEHGALLAIDTSTSSMSVALTRGGELLGELSSKAERNHSIHLLPSIGQLLASSNMHPRDLSAVAVGVGPGSYTGVRIGVTVAKTFAWTHDMALIGVSSLEALALGGAEVFLAGEEPSFEQAVTAGSPTERVCSQQPETQWIVPMFEARRGQAFTGLYEASPNGWSCLVSDGIRLMTAWVDELLGRASQKGGGNIPDRVLFVGETALHTVALERFFTGWGGKADIVAHEMRARHIADIGRRNWQVGRTENPHLLVPNYTQLTEAEANLLKQKS